MTSLSAEREEGRPKSDQKDYKGGRVATIKSPKVMGGGGRDVRSI